MVALQWHAVVADDLAALQGVPDLDVFLVESARQWLNVDRVVVDQAKDIAPIAAVMDTVKALIVADTDGVTVVARAAIEVTVAQAIIKAKAPDTDAAQVKATADITVAAKVGRAQKSTLIRKPATALVIDVVQVAAVRAIVVLVLNVDQVIAVPI